MKKSNEELLTWFLITITIMLIVLTLNGCSTQRDVVKKYHSGGVTPTGVNKKIANYEKRKKKNTGWN